MKKRQQNVVVYVILAVVVVVIFVMAISSVGTPHNSPTQAPLTPPSIVGVGNLTPAPQNDLFGSGVKGSLSASQQSSFDKLSANSSLQPWVREENGVIRFSVMRLGIPDKLGKQPEEKVKAFLNEYQDLLNISDPTDNFQRIQQKNNPDGSVRISINQTINNVPVYGANISIMMSATGEITSLTGGYVPGQVTPISPVLSADQAINTIITQYGINPRNISSQTSLLYVDDVVFGASSSNLKLAWKVEIIDDDGNLVKSVCIDATNGEILFEIPTLHNYEVNVYNNQQRSYTNLSRAIHIMNTGGCLQGQACDQDAQDAHTFSRQYEDFIWANYRPQGHDKNTETINAYTHITIPMDLLCLNLGGGPNAFWDDERQAISFTDGMSHANDIVFHELTHRLISQRLIENDPNGECNGLCYRGQSGALSESFADIFGILIDNGDPGNSWTSPTWFIQDWTLGEDSTIGVVRDISQTPPAYRNENNPNCRNDYGYVHANSVIPSKAAHLLLQEQSFQYGSFFLEGIGPRKVSQIYYRAISNHINENTNFDGARDAILLSCFELIGKFDFDIQRNDCVQVANAFAAIGIGEALTNNQSPTVTPPSSITLTPISPLPLGGISSTVLVLDTSGSMDEIDASQNTKLQAAQLAANNILNIIAAEVQGGSGQGSQVGLVDFNRSSRIDSALTPDIATVQSALQSLRANGGTGMAEGLQTGLSLFPNQSTTVKQMIILLSDGNPNVPLPGSIAFDITSIQQEVLDLATQAGNRGICVYTIGFGIPSTQSGLSQGGSIDEDFLKQVAAASKCGTYYSAQDANQLANVFVDLRHSSMGNVVFQQSGQISQGQQIDLGDVEVPANQELMLFTLNWPGSKLEPVLKDPTGTMVDQNYPGVTISTSSTLVSIVMNNPKAGNWNLSVLGVDVPEGVTQYNTIISTRAGTAVLPPQGGGSFPVAVLILVLSGGAIGVYVYSRSIQRSGRRAGVTAAGAQFVGTRGAFAGQTVSLRDGLIIGRGSASSVRLNDPSVSRWHARLRFAQGAWYIQDMGSKSGILINGQKVNAARLNPGDQIQIGTSLFTFQAGGK